MALLRSTPGQRFARWPHRSRLWPRLLGETILRYALPRLRNARRAKANRNADAPASAARDEAAPRRLLRLRKASPSDSSRPPELECRANWSRHIENGRNGSASRGDRRRAESGLSQCPFPCHWQALVSARIRPRTTELALSRENEEMDKTLWPSPGPPAISRRAENRAYKPSIRIFPPRDGRLP